MAGTVRAPVRPAEARRDPRPPDVADAPNVMRAIDGTRIGTVRDGEAWPLPPSSTRTPRRSAGP